MKGTFSSKIKFCAIVVAAALFFFLMRQAPVLAGAPDSICESLLMSILESDSKSPGRAELESYVDKLAKQAIAAPGSDAHQGSHSAVDLALLPSLHSMSDTPISLMALKELSGKFFHDHKFDGKGYYDENRDFVPIKPALRLLLLDGFDGESRSLILELTRRSRSKAEGRQFVAEMGAWVVTLKTGRRVAVFVQGGVFAISGQNNEIALWRVMFDHVKDYSEIRRLQFFHIHPDGDPFLSRSDIIAAMHIKSDKYFARTRRPGFEIQVYASSLVEGEVVTTEFSL